jgi:hypothetical protein
MTTHNAPEFKHPDEMPWGMGRFKNATKFLFHPTAERPNTPNAGFLRYEPGGGFPFHKHDFAQIWYIIEGEFQMGRKKYGPAPSLHGGPSFRGRDAYGDRRHGPVRPISRTDHRRAPDL